jgi:hypothetical protein
MIVAVIVALAVAMAAHVSVAARVNGNDIVNVIDAVRRSGVDELREHGNDPLKQVDAAFVQLVFDQLTELHDVQVRSTFHRGASGDIGRHRRSLRASTSPQRR